MCVPIIAGLYVLGFFPKNKKDAARKQRKRLAKYT